MKQKKKIKTKRIIITKIIKIIKKRDIINRMTKNRIIQEEKQLIIINQEIKMIKKKIEKEV